jgi:hypothetical protein
VTTVLNADTLAATPAMNAAISAVTARPSIPLGRYSAISAGMALLYSWPGWEPDPKPFTVTSATRPGITTSSGMNSLGKAAISGVRCAAFMSFADRARCTSAKFVVQ